VALAEAVGARVVVAHLPRRFDTAILTIPGAQQRSVKLRFPVRRDVAYRRFILEELPAFQETTQVKIALETMPRRIVWRIGPQLWHLNTPRDWSHLPSLVLDTTHIGTWGYDLLEIYELLKKRITHVHLSNFNGREHRLLTDGHLPLAQFLRRLKRDGYSGIISVETHPDALGAEDPDIVRARLRQTYEFCAENYC